MIVSVSNKGAKVEIQATDFRYLEFSLRYSPIVGHFIGPVVRLPVIS